MPVCFVLTRTVLIQLKINSAVFILPCDTCTFYRHSIFCFLLNKEGLSLCVDIFSTYGWLTQGNKEESDRGLGSVCFWEHHCCLFAFEASSSSHRKHGLWELSNFPLSCWGNMLTVYSLWLLLTLMPCGLTGVLAHGVSHMLYVNGVTRGSGHPYCSHIIRICLHTCFIVPFSHSTSLTTPTQR